MRFYAPSCATLVRTSAWINSLPGSKVWGYLGGGGALLVLDWLLVSRSGLGCSAPAYCFCWFQGLGFRS